MSFEEYIDAINRFYDVYQRTQDSKFKKYMIEVLTYLTEQLAKTFKEENESYSGD